MSSIYGIFARNGGGVAPEHLIKIHQALSHWQAERNNHYQENNIGLGQLLLTSTLEPAHEHLHYKDDHSHLVITADARIYNRLELLTLIEHSPTVSQNMSDSQLILHAYLKWGIDCSKYLEGDFAFAIWDKNKQQLFCSRDHMGVRPFFYYCSDDYFALATEPRGLLALPFVNSEESEEWVADTLLLDPIYKSDTYFKNIKRLKAAHSMIIERDQFKTWSYWKLAPMQEIIYSNDDDYVEQYYEIFRQAVTNRIQGKFRVGSELSGGLDSSSICAVAADYLNSQDNPLITFSNVLDEHGQQPSHIKDEKEQILTVLEYCKIEQYHFLGSDDRSILQAYQKMISYENGPLPDMHSLLSDILLETAQQTQVRTILSGFGGDELATHNAGNLLTECIHQGRWRDYFKEIRAYQKKTGGKAWKQIVISFLKAYVPSIYYTYLTKLRKINEGIPLLYDKYGPLGGVHNFKIKSQLAINTGRPSSLKHTTLSFPPGTIKEQAAIMVSHYKYLCERIECSSLAGLHHQLQYTFPLLDRKLLEFCINTPSNQFRFAGVGRQLMRRAMKDRLPESIRLRTDKTGATTPSCYNRLMLQKSDFKDAISKLYRLQDPWSGEQLLQNFVAQFEDYVINNSKLLLNLVYLLIVLTLEFYGQKQIKERR